MRILKSPIVIGIIAFVGGVMLADTVKPMLAKIPFVGGLLGGGDGASSVPKI